MPSSNRKRPTLVVVGGAVALGVLLWVMVLSDLAPLSAKVKLDGQYHAVLLTNGQVYFGRLEKLGSAYPVLTEVYYVQTQVNQEAKQVANTLVKRGKEWHAPERMILNASHILLVEPVTPDSTVAKLIDELKNQK